MINDLSELIAINSVLSTPEPNAPFGIGCRKALDKFLQISAKYGFSVSDLDGYAGWAEYGKGNKLIGILGHLDIVPASSGWSTDPFKLTIDNGMMYGRGVSDDKGPLVACLHALKRIKDEKLNLNARVRIIAGCNEESGSNCIKYYTQHCEIPAYSFTPDSDFPVIASEKGIAHLAVNLTLSDCVLQNIQEIKGGTRANVVPDFASFSVIENSELAHKLSSASHPIDCFKSSEVLETLASYGCEISDFDTELNNNIWTISAKGVSAHGSTPEKGDNALRKIFALLSALFPSDTALGWAANITGTKPKDFLKNDFSDNTGTLTINIGIAELNADGLLIVVDMRSPASFAQKDVIETFKATLPLKAELKTLTLSHPLSFDENHPLIQSLLGVYAGVTGDCASKPLHIGGGTYAKELPNCVAFGAVFPGDDTHMHEPDECYSVEKFYKLVDIYYEAIKALAVL